MNHGMPSMKSPYPACRFHSSDKFEAISTPVKYSHSMVGYMTNSRGNTFGKAHYGTGAGTGFEKMRADLKILNTAKPPPNVAWQVMLSMQHTAQ